MAATGNYLLTAERVWTETESEIKFPTGVFDVFTPMWCFSCTFSEVDALFGVPAPEKWHPEIDTGIHTLMVMKVIAELSNNVDIRFAALCHDLGKALTPTDICRPSKPR